MSTEARGHLLALLTIVLWGTTFVSTKILLQHDLSPLEILGARFLLGACFLMLLYPKRLKGTTWREELCFALAGLCGTTFYFWFENHALLYTLAANAALISSTSPFFTVLLARFFLKEEHIHPIFYVGMLLSFVGVGLMSFSGLQSFELSLKGDALALGAAFIWSIYAIVSKKMGSFGYNTIQTTRRTFWYGLLFMLPMISWQSLEFSHDALLNYVHQYASPVVMFNLLFLGLGASALCFVTWNLAVKILGAIKTSLYINAVPMVTVIFSTLILHEHITLLSALGILLVLMGLGISQYQRKSSNS